MTDIRFRVVVEREGGQTLQQTRSEILGLAQAQQQLNTQVRPAAGLVDQYGNSLSRSEVAMQTAARSTITGTRGINVFKSAVTGLAFEATGTAGPIGRLASSILMFSGGGALVVGVGAGIALIGGAINLMGREARQTEARIQSLRTRTEELLEVEDPTRGVRRELGGAHRGLAQARDRLARLQAGTFADEDLGAVAAGVGAGVQVDPKVAIERSQREIAEFERNITALGEKLTKLTGDAGASAAAAWVENFQDRLHDAMTRADVLGMDRLRAELEARIGGAGMGSRRELAPLRGEVERALSSTVMGMPELGRPSFRLPEIRRPETPTLRDPAIEFNRQAISAAEGIIGQLRSPVQVIQGQIDELNLAMQLAPERAVEFSEGIKRLKEEMAEASKQSTVLAVSIVGAVSGAIAGIAGGGGTGGFLSGLGGIAGLIPGLAIPGAVLGGLGSIISASESRGVRIDEYSSRALSQMKSTREGPDTIRLVVVDSNGQSTDRIQYELRRRERLDRTSRLPGSGLGG